MKKPLLALILTFTLLLAACSSENGGLFKEGIVEFISNEYTIYDTVSSATDSANFSEIYIAENQTVDAVAANIISHQQPIEMSEMKEGKQVLIYENLFVILTADDENQGNTYIEVANNQFIRDNYSYDFFDGLFLAWVLDDVLDVDDWGKKRQMKCKQYPENCYDGYGHSGGSFKGLNKTPTIRNGSSSVRGGGPGAGK
ncbi:DUF4247 domain-containing protein [Bacillus sp. Marseille-P3661]|uniref:DUF4247 domain-containing protein n=1 Tax=Bacillus sp. Marseille-P3661 TaxID=1936234 RepID=UPI000C828EAC|nr:DUF4247 domain-containing protein [Bacillus sp. Marseille-P3661]